MKKLLYLIWVILFAVVLYGQNLPPNIVITPQNGITVASTIPLPVGLKAGTLVVATNGANGTDCATGGGTSHVLCEYNGTSWVTIGGSGGSGVPGGSNTQLEYNNNGVFGGLAGSSVTSNGQVTLAPTATSVSALILNCLNGVTVDCFDVEINGTKNFKVDSSGNGTFSGSVQVGSSASAGLDALYGNATLPTLPSGDAGWLGPNGAVSTPWWMQIPVSGPTGPVVFTLGNPSSNISQVTFYAQLPVSLGGTGVSDFNFSGTTHTVGSVNGSLTGNAGLIFDSNGNVIAGPNILGVKSVTTAGYTATNADCGYHESLSNASAQTYNLPTSAPTAGCFIDLQNVGAGTWTISPGTLTLDGSSSSISIATGQGVRIYSDGSNYSTQRGSGTGGYTLPTQYTKLRCSPGLGDGLNAIAAGTYLQTTCYNDSGVTWTITGVKCFTDNNGTSTLNATDNAANALLTGAVSCTNSFAAGTQSATTTIASGGYIKFTFVSDGASKQTTWVVSMTQ